MIKKYKKDLQTYKLRNNSSHESIRRIIWFTDGFHSAKAISNNYNKGKQCSTELKE